MVAGLGIWAATSDELAFGKHKVPLWCFLAIVALLPAFIVLMGWGITGVAAGALVDPKRGG